MMKIPNKENSADKIKKSIIENKWILIVILIMIVERLVAMLELGITNNLNSDDMSYFISGIVFKNTGTITMHGVVSAQIMPGMTIIIAVFSTIFGEGKLLWLMLKLLWFLISGCTAFFIYKLVVIYAPKWCGILTVIPLFAPDFVWMDNIILTETPFMFFFVAMIYFTIMMGKQKSWKYFFLCLICYMGALMLKANIAIYPVFAFLYLLIIKYDFKKIIKQCIVLLSVVACFIIPWSIRNYSLFNEFIPLTYGGGNPLLLGTYQGVGYPSDKELDYRCNVDDVAKKKFKNYYYKDGELKKSFLDKYISLKKDGIKAKYRMSEWFDRNPVKMICSYLVIKPRSMINSVFYWQNIFETKAESIIVGRKVNLLLCILIIFSSFYLKKNRLIVSFISILYLANIYIYSITFAFSRYAATLMPLRFVLIGIGIPLIIRVFEKAFMSIKRQYY